MMNDKKELYDLASSVESHLSSLEDVLNSLREYAELVDELVHASPEIIGSDYYKARMENIQSVFNVCVILFQHILNEIGIDIEDVYKASGEKKDE